METTQITRALTLATALALLGGAWAATTQVGLIDLTEDLEITVAAGDRYEVCTLSASDVHTLVKKGDGDLYVGRVTSTRPRIDLKGGRLFVGPNLTKPALFASAAFHVDANESATLTTSESEGKTYVSNWSDLNGGTHCAANATAARQPWLTTLENGKAMLDFGTLKNDKTSGIGAYLLFDSDVTGVRAALCVQQIHAETVAAPESSCSQGIGCYDESVFSTFTKAAGKGPYYANKWQGMTKQVRGTDDQSGLGGSISVNGKKLASILTAASAELEVVDYKIVDPEEGKTDYARADQFARDLWNHSTGGMMIGEAVLFTTALTDDEHALLSHYLMVKWQGYGIPFTDQITVGEGTSASFWNGTAYDVVSYHEPNVFQAELNVTNDTSVSVNAGVTNEVYVLKGDAHTLTKTGAGVLKIVQVEATDVTLDIQGGEVLFDDPSVPGTIFRDSILWLDADNAAMRVEEAGAEKTLVTAWNDANGGAVSASVGSQAPYLTQENGRTYVDFGTVSNTSWETTKTGYGAWMRLSANQKGFRECFAVVRPSEGLVPLGPSGPLITPFGSESNWKVFKPGFNYKNYYPSIINRYQECTMQVRAGITVDGKPGSVVNDGQLWVAGVHVYGFRIDEPANVGLTYDAAEFDSIGRNASENWGGFRLGEMIVYPTQLAAADRARCQQTLMAKWQGVAGCTQQVSSVSVAAGAQAKLAYVNVEIDGALALAGSLEVQSVKASVIAPLSSAATVTGTLDLTEPGVVRIDHSLYGEEFAEGFVRILAASSVKGNARGWRVESTSAKPVRLRAFADGLYATEHIDGMSVIIR